MIHPYAKGTFSGNYQPHGNIEDGQVISGHAFGLLPDGGPGIPNEGLGKFIDGFDVLKIVSRDIAPAMNTMPDAVMTGKATNTTASEGIGAWGELEATQQYMAANGLTRLILAGQAFHIGRVERQAKALLARPGSYQFDIIIPEGLPNDWDLNSEQWWIRGPKLWAARESLAVGKLVIDKQLRLRDMLHL